MSQKYKEYTNLNLPNVAEEVLVKWKKNNTFQNSIDTRSENKPYIFFEGPPSANGMPGIHHVMGRAIKDIFCRYKTLQGFRLGKFAVTDVQQATAQLQDVRLRKVQLLKQAWQLSIDVQSARIGLATEQITAKDALMQLNQRVWQQSNAFPSQVGE